MITYSIREFKTKFSEILRSLDDGEEIIITRRGDPCGRLIAIAPLTEDKPSLGTLRGTLAELPDASYVDFQDIKGIWNPDTTRSYKAPKDTP